MNVRNTKLTQKTVKCFGVHALTKPGEYNKTTILINKQYNNDII